MGNPSEPSEEIKPLYHIEYVREAPHPKFTSLQIDYIRSIDRILTPEEVDVVSKVESFRLWPENGDVRCHEVPGLRSAYGNTVVYVQRYSAGLFAEFMERVMDHIAGEPQGPKMFLRFISPVRILVPDVGVFYPLTYGVGALEWRAKVRRKMAQVGALTGEFDNGKFVLSNGTMFPVASVRIERDTDPGPGYAADW